MTFPLGQSSSSVGRRLLESFLPLAKLTLDTTVGPVKRFRGGHTEAAGHLERFWYARGFGMVRWERWEDPSRNARVPERAAWFADTHRIERTVPEPLRHYRWTTVGGRLLAVPKPRLKEAGTRHIRDGGTEDEFIEKLRSVHQVGVTTTLISDVSIDATKNTLRKAGPAIDAVTATLGSPRDVTLSDDGLEKDWLNAFRSAKPGQPAQRPPQLLGPMASMLASRRRLHRCAPRLG